MQSSLWLVAAVVVLIVLLAIAWWYTRRRQHEQRREELRGQFGGEYDRAVAERGNETAAQQELAARQQRVEQLAIRPLSSPDRSRFAASWHHVQSRFVDDPKGAVTEADGLVGEVMQTRGYPMTDFEQRAADVSVDHPAVVDHYRQAHDIAERDASGKATTEQLRQAMVHYRALFEDLLDEGRGSQATDAQAATGGPR